MVIADSQYLMGDGRGDGNRPDGESPVHEVRLSPFSVDSTAVTNEAFAAFVGETGYVTDAEREGSSFVFHLALAADEIDVLGRSAHASWWLAVRGADWRHPDGPRSDIDGLAEHPVVHASWFDAVAYCRWSRRRLPTEAEWEFASRGGLVGARFPWGDEQVPDGTWQANIWQGDFPFENTGEDGWLTTAPVLSYQPNGLGLWQTVGNVWEWCADWYSERYYAESLRLDPLGPPTGQARVIRGGSYLCHDSYCNRYRNSARSSNTPESSTANTGFRTASSTRAHDPTDEEDRS